MTTDMQWRITLLKLGFQKDTSYKYFNTGKNEDSISTMPLTKVIRTCESLTRFQNKPKFRTPSRIVKIKFYNLRK